MRAVLFLVVFAGFLQVATSCSKPTTNKPQTVTQPPVDTSVTPPVTPTTVDTLKTYLALGDSYTIGQSEPADQNYPNQTVALLNSTNVTFQSPEIIATTGWTTGDLLNAIANKVVPTPPYNVVTLLIGVNNQYQGRSQSEYKTQFTELLQKSIAYAGNRVSHVIVMSIPDYSVSPYGQNTGNATYIATQIDSFNLINKQVSDSFNVNYLNITDTSRQALNNPTLFANDGLHFSGEEYAIWSSMLLPIIQNMLK